MWILGQWACAIGIRCGHYSLGRGILELKIRTNVQNRISDVPRGETKEFDDEAHNGIATAAQPTTLRSNGFSSDRPVPPLWWSHRLYRGPEGKEIEIMYSKTKTESEAIAQRFLDEPILGFDMEWPWGYWVEDTLQNKIGLIQVASEDKIGLIHIGLHPGKTSRDIIAPSLKKIIEDPNIGKVGVNILKADFSRLSQYFGLQPKGAIELSHLNRLVKFGPRRPEYVTVKLVSLAQQVEEQLGLPLYKGDVRTSDWSKPLSEEQIDYAAGDAYAGFMLYKCMNAKRLSMKPTPPPPIYAERYPSGRASRDDPILLDVGDGTTITTAEFFGVKPVKSSLISTTSKARNTEKILEPLDETSQALYDELLVRRALLAEKGNIPPTRVVSDVLLRAIARARPLDAPALLAIKGVGKVQQRNYGDEWVQVISKFLTKNGIEESASTDKSSPSKEEEAHILRIPRRIQVARRVLSDLYSPLAFDEPPPRVPQLHTGLSFTLAESKLDAHGTALKDNESDYGSDNSLISLEFGSPRNRRESSGTKRKPTPSKSEPTIRKSISHAPPKQAPSISDPNLSPSSRIAKSKLLAFSKLVTSKLPERRPATALPIVSPHTLDLIVRARPQTQEELERIPGVDSLLLACERTGIDLLRNVVKFVGA
ncbi:hypothetical protein J3E72DRAFT_438731 [Bipolaris maydis]|nr:hypothetical protein J3E72DRAFT_438731 [Bipolaris maydis]